MPSFRESQVTGGGQVGFSTLNSADQSPASSAKVQPLFPVKTSHSNRNVATESSVVDTVLARRDSRLLRKQILMDRFAALGLTDAEVSQALQRAKLSGASIVQDLIAEGTIYAEDYYRRLAEEIGVKYVERINPAIILSEMSVQQTDGRAPFQLFGRGDNGLTILYVAPDFDVENSILDLISRDPTQKERIRICTPSVLAKAIEAKTARYNSELAANNLHQQLPALSAKQVFAPWQAYSLGVFCAALPVFIYHDFRSVALVIQIATMTLFFVVVLIRLAALIKLKSRCALAVPQATKTYPRYSVLIALHKEAAVAAQLVNAMSRLDWPASKLEVFYVCEADDSETIEALLENGMPPNHRIIRVPPGLPRTKPKALNYALKACSGEFVVIYDAEDRPHHQQLKEAWSRFCAEDRTLACLQAPLLVSNGKSSWLALMFAFEYAAHFKGLLPYLAQAGVPLPLGGTSNHFRKSALESVGGWDPYNVTEDADLGIRLYRFGFRCGILEKPTLEDGPETFKEWYPQRTRWQKGWMQTLLVQNRNVRQLTDALGSRSTLHFEAVIMGFIFSPLLYSLSIPLAFYSIYTLESGHAVTAITGLSLLIMGYLCAIAMGFECSKHWSVRDKAAIGFTLPIYWLLISAAAWRAVYQLLVKPHHWEKTPHRPVSSFQLSNDHLEFETTAQPA